MDVFDPDEPVVINTGDRSPIYIEPNSLHLREGVQTIGATNPGSIQGVVVAIQSQNGYRPWTVTSRFYRICSDDTHSWVEESDDGLNFPRASRKYRKPHATLHR